MGLHAKLSPSASGRWFLCPGSIRMEESVPKRRPSVNFYADEGTAAHSVLEHCLRNHIDPYAFHEEFVVVDGNRYPVDLEMKDAVSLAYDYVSGYRIVHGDTQLYPERQVNPGAWMLRDDLFGTADVTIEGQDELCIADYKHGRGIPIDVVGNTQLLIYALGAALPSFRWPKYRLVIIQPRARHEDGPIREWVITREELKAFFDTLEQKASATEEKDAEIVPGDKQCSFCDAKPFCKELAQYNLDVARGEFVDMDGLDLEEPPKTQNPQFISLAQLRYILDNSQMLVKWIKSVEEYAQQLLEKGQTVPGYKLAKKRAYRKWALEEDVVAAILTTIGLDPDRVYTRKLNGPAPIERELKALKDKGALARFYEIVEKNDTGVTIVPESDPRPAVAMNTIADDFGEDENE